MSQALLKLYLPPFAFPKLAFQYPRLLVVLDCRGCKQKLHLEILLSGSTAPGTPKSIIKRACIFLIVKRS